MPIDAATVASSWKGLKHFMRKELAPWPFGRPDQTYAAMRIKTLIEPNTPAARGVLVQIPSQCHPSQSHEATPSAPPRIHLTTTMSHHATA
jgi:hypothetical protein